MHKFYIITLRQCGDIELSALERLFKNDGENPNWLFHGSSNGNCIEILSPIDETCGRECGQDVAKERNGYSGSVLDGMGESVVRFSASLHEAHSAASSKNNDCVAIWAVNKKMLEEVYGGYYQQEIRNRKDEGIRFNGFAKILVESIKKESAGQGQRLVGTQHGVVPLFLEGYGWCLVPFNKKGFMTDLYETLKFNPYRGDEVDLNTLANSLPEVAVVKVVIHCCISTLRAGTVK